MNHNKVVREQALHIAFGALFFVIIGVFAVGLDLASSFIRGFGVSEFTGKALELTAHTLLVIDLALFFVYIVTTSYDLVKMMTQRDHD